MRARNVVRGWIQDLLVGCISNVGIVACTLFVFSCSSAQGAGAAAIGEPRSDIAVLRFVINHAPVDGYVADDEAVHFREEKFAQEATGSAASVVNSSLHPSVNFLSAIFSPDERLETKLPANLLLSGSISMPVILPPSMRGWAASHQAGVLATAHLILKEVDGNIFKEFDATIKWDDVRWSTGGRARKARNPDDVLSDAVKVVAVKGTLKLLESLKSGRL
jgi:hypothetical protein